MTVLLAAIVVASRTIAPAATVSPEVAARAQSRARGNDRAAAVALGEVLLGTEWPAQVLHVHVDSAQGHRIAGLVLSGTKFHRPLDEAGFLDEVKTLVRLSFAHADVEEVDVWATVPADAGKGAVVSGDFALPAEHNVFSVTIRRSDLPRLDGMLRSNGVYWDAAWRATLHTAS